MNYDEIIVKLNSLSSEKQKANVVRMGIPEESSIGVSTGDVRKLAKEIGKSNEMAEQLWNSGYHEGKLLAVLLYDKKQMTIEKVQSMLKDVFSWDLCDHLCKNLIIKIKGYQELIDKLCGAEGTYEKRAAFTLMASAAIHEKKLTDEILDSYLKLIREYSDDSREHVKKAASWALREIGKRDFDYQEKAVLLAHEFLETESQPQIWIAKDALKELETLVKVEGRTRLISSKSKMGMEK